MKVKEHILKRFASRLNSPKIHYKKSMKVSKEKLYFDTGLTTHPVTSNSRSKPRDTGRRTNTGFKEGCLCIVKLNE